MSRVAKTTVVWCGYCEDERRRKRGKLGWLRRSQVGAKARWYATDPRWHRKRRAGGWPAGFDVSQIIVGDDHDPAELKVFCRWHGAGLVPTRDVTSASGRLTLNFTALR